MSNDWIESALTLFRAACELPEDERTAFLDKACGQDAEFRRHVDAMLAWDDSEDLAKDDTVAPHPVRAALGNLVQQAESVAADTASLPDSIGGYRIVRLVARGGMGVVYEAEQDNPQRRVALKVARVGGTTGERARRFELEAQLLARLSHPGIAQIIEAGTTSPEAGAQPFFVMEFVEGQSLMAYAEAHLATAREKLEVMVRVCEAVAFAHDEGVVHRDLKPDNVFIDAGGKPKVLDFGVAKVEAAGGFGAATLRTEAGRVLGTLGYMAPEQLGGKTEGLGPEADVYSLGVMIYQLLSSRLPHELDGVTLTRALAVVTTTDAPPLGVIRPEFRGDIEAVVAKALEKDHRHRYADAGALQADLDRHLRGDPILARPAGLLRRVTKWTRRNPALATAVFGLFLALSTVAAILLVKNEEVRTALADYGRLEDARRLEQAIAQAAPPLDPLPDGELGKLWPTRPEQIDALEDWLAIYDPLVETERIGDHRAAVARIEAQAGTLVDGTWTFAEEEEPLQWKHDTLVQLLQDLEVFESDRGLLRQVNERLALARNIERLTVDDRSADWDAAITRIQQNENGHYPDLKNLAPQVGLVPLGADPESGLEEFLHFETHAGEIPRRDDEEHLPPLTGDTGLIFVLIPGGTFWMGCQSDDENGRNFDPGAIGGGEGPARWEVLYEVEDVPPFFLSKYEMTQGQWERFVGKNPSAPPKPGTPVKPTKPVNRVSWKECDEVMRRLGLVLPDEVQWEYAARATTTTAWWTGQDEGTLEGAEDLTEQATMEHIADWWPAKKGIQPADWYDREKSERLSVEGGGPAPVGSYRANAFGLFDVGGNVTEWCSNIPGYRRDNPPDSSTVPVRMIRGGNFKVGVKEARSAWRMDIPLVAASDELGLRPAMAILR